MADMNVAEMKTMETSVSAVSPQVPIISVTPHSPAGISINNVNKQYSVLEDNLKQLHDIVEAVQHMKDANINALSVNTQILKIGEQCIRLSCSCPSLNEVNSDPDAGGNSATSSPSHADLSASMSTPYISISSSSVHSKQRESGDWKSISSRIGSLSSGEILRRRSWAALEDLSAQRELDRKISKQRSISLSSLESDVEDLFAENESSNSVIPRIVDSSTTKSAHSVGRSVRQSNAVGNLPSNISTHSLNEADLVNDFNKIRLKREEEARLLQARLPLQKSISTPSILAVATRDACSSFVADSVPAATNSSIPNSVCFNLSTQKPNGTESETEEEMLVALLDDCHLQHFPYDEVVQSTAFETFLQEKSVADGTSVANAFTYDDRPEKRRKRGSSLFFRKKKEKTKKLNPTHAWISVAPSNSNNVVLCDWCSKTVDAKNARQCTGCFITVHQGLCVQHISTTECHQKVKADTKVLSKNASQQLHSLNKSANRKSANIALVAGSSSQGNSPVINEEDAYFMKHQQVTDDHLINCSEEVPLVTQEFLNEEQLCPSDLNTDPFLGLQDEEPETWTPNVTKEVVKKLTDKEIKRQEHIYEFILTEKHHCLTLILMQKIFVDGLKKHFNLGHDLYRMFPRLTELIDIHFNFLYNLRKKQREAPVVDSISDVLLEQFSGNAAIQLQSVYGEFCSGTTDARQTYNFHMENNSGFAAFVKHCQNNPMLKKKGISECMLFVTQRITKYPLLIKPLIEASDNEVEIEKLSRAEFLVKYIIKEVNSRVGEKSRKLEIYHKIDAKSFAIYRNNKFKKSDILSNNRKLRFEGWAYLMQGRTKQQLVSVIVLSDVLFFLVENNNKFTFFTPDGKPGVICIHKLLVRDKAADPKIIYLISSNPSDPEMFELKIHKPKDKESWVSSIREAVQKSLEDEQQIDDSVDSMVDKEKQRKAYVSQRHMNQIVDILRRKDVEQALIYEEKISLLLKLLSAAGVDTGIEPPSYCHLVSEYLDNDFIRKEVVNTIQKVNQLTSSLYITGTNLSRSASSVGERQSNAYVSPLLPKRAETFGGFDNAISCKGFVAGVGRKLSQQFQKKSHDFQDLRSHSPSLPSSPVGTPELNSRKLENFKNLSPPTVNITLPSQPPPPPSTMSSQQELPSLLQLEIEQQSVAVQLTSHIYTLASIVAQQMTSIDSLEAQLALCRHEMNQSSGEKDRKPVYKHNQQLEELRNLQDKLTQEKEQWQREKENEQKDLEEKRKQLLRLQEQIKNEQEDVTQQREQLYRKLELLSSQGLNPSLMQSPQPGSGGAVSLTASPPSLLLDLSSSATSLPASSSLSSSSPSSDNWKRRNDSVRWKQSATSSGNTLPLNLLSATNQQKVASSNVQVKQKIPLKLATKLGGSSSNGGGGVGANTNSSASSPSLSTTSSSGTKQQQIFPWKLRESNPTGMNVVAAGTAELRRSVAGANSSTSGYERLVTENSSTTTSTSPSHSRTGSSPAMMQNTGVSPPSTQTEERDGTKTNTYPKFPEKYRTSLGATANESNMKCKNTTAEEEKVIFF